MQRCCHADKTTPVSFRWYCICIRGIKDGPPSRETDNCRGPQNDAQPSSEPTFRFCWFDEGRVRHSMLKNKNLKTGVGETVGPLAGVCHPKTFFDGRCSAGAPIGDPPECHFRQTPTKFLKVGRLFFWGRCRPRCTLEGPGICPPGRALTQLSKVVDPKFWVGVCQSGRLGRGVIVRVADH
jgi:hypothetical protein